MNRVAIVAVAFATACVAVPAEATSLYQFAYSANVVGEQTVYDPSGPFCSTNPLGCLAQRPYSGTFSGTTTFASEDGTGAFMIGSGCANCTTYSGTIIGSLNTGYQGVSFVYASGNPTIVGSVYATAPVFSVRLLAVNGIPPVPEPATWAMMMLGFGGIGYAMRRKANVSTRISFA